jgi:hypothetical protein
MVSKNTLIGTKMLGKININRKNLLLVLACSTAMTTLLNPQLNASTLEVGAGKPYATIQAAVNAAAGGDEIKIYAGTYAETVLVTDKENLYIHANDGDKVVVDGGFNMYNASSATWTQNNLIEGLWFDRTGDASGWAVQHQYGRSNEYLNCVFFGDNSGSNGIYGYLSYGLNRARNCTFYGLGYPYSNGYASGLHVYDSIVAFNANQPYNYPGGYAGVTTYSDYYNNASLPANVGATMGTIHLDPKFFSTDPADPDFLHLKAISPCVGTASDAGNMGALPIVGTGPPELLSSEPEHATTFARLGNNRLTLVFANSLEPNDIPSIPLNITTLNGLTDLSSDFSYSLATTIVSDDTLLADENATVFENNEWYRIEPNGVWSMSFELEIQAIRGDIDAKGRIDQKDFAMLAAVWDSPSSPLGRSDLDGDDQIDNTDIAILADYWAGHRILSGSPEVAIYGWYSQDAADNGVDIVMPSITWYDPTSVWLLSTTSGAHGQGMVVYPSLATAIDGPDAVGCHQFAKDHPEYVEKWRNGNLMNTSAWPGMHLSWGYPEVRQFKADTVVALVVDHNCDGVLLDYTRYFGNETGYSDIIVSDFIAFDGRDPFSISADDPAFIQFRADYVTDFIGLIRTGLDAVDPNLKIVACVNPDPDESLQNSMQNWEKWLDLGLIDAVKTMIYERNTNDTIEKVIIARDTIRGRVPLYPMIACAYSNLNTAEMLKEGSMKCLAAGVPGVAYYHTGDLNVLNLWSTLGEISSLDMRDISAETANYCLNPSFENDFEFWAIGAGAGIQASTSKARTGTKSLKVSFPVEASARQIVYSGIMEKKTALQVKARFDTSEITGASDVNIELQIHYNDSMDNFYRVPVAVTATPGWQETIAQVYMPNSSDVKFIVLNLAASADGGYLYADDFELHLMEETIDPNDYAFTPSATVITNPGAVNLARGQLVTGSSYLTNDYVFDNAVDGDITDIDYGKDADWHSARPPISQSITVYLPHTYEISSIEMLNGSYSSVYGTKDYKVELSTDDLNYTQVSNGTLPDDSTTWTQDNITPTPARYIKFTGINGRHSDYTVGLKEIELY